ncbi:Uncharacterised protein [Gallibacterium anatis]|uniref:Uncharacterized protein n=1 Tax=Gallibacterium anatis TaxID=750 RepID=A0A377H4K2_9PAST|nr:hypothetical protein [Gallibacterium anatis]KGQ59348.1 hypothetical protein IE01_00065 [Gallibacterium anatis DSM 16844 = F 149]STO37424.1 Uncharacterised protein [Gallibacterium anatis]
MDTQTNKTNKFVSIIVSLITNVFFISVKIIVAIFSLVFHLGSKSSSDDERLNNSSKNPEVTTVSGEGIKLYNLDGQHPYYGYNEDDS